MRERDGEIKMERERERKRGSYRLTVNVTTVAPRGQKTVVSYSYFVLLFANTEINYICPSVC